MVECLLCKQNVAGSNPTTSTKHGSSLRHFLLIFEKRKLETKENYNSYTRSGCAVPARPGREDFSRQELARRAGPVRARRAVAPCC